MVEVDVSEVKAWERVLSRAGVDIVRVNEEALTEAAKQLKADAQRDAPVRTGALRRSIRVYAGKEWRRVGSPLRQGFFQEFGTSKMSPQPWLFANAERAGSAVEKQLTVGGVKVLLR